jgi:hypothetical protein
VFLNNEAVPVLKHYAIKMYGGMEANFRSFLDLGLDGCQWSASPPATLTLRKVISTKWDIGPCGKKKKPVPLLGTEPHPSNLQPDALLTELSQLCLVCFQVI